MVALVIMALMAVIAWSGLDTMVRAREIGQAASERTLLLSTVIAQWEQDLQAVQDSATTPSSSAVPNLSFDGASLRLVRRTERGLQLVVWSLREGAWQRWTAPAATQVPALQEAWFRSQQLQGSEPGHIKLLDKVQGWQIYFFRGEGWSNAQSTGDALVPTNSPTNAPNSAPPGAGPVEATQQKLPTGVRLVIDLPEGKLTRDVLMRSS